MAHVAGIKVIVVGAGFAGLVAARELEGAGIETVVYEARDRIGGRAWTEERMGHPLELGATWVHWLQPFIWTEIMRYRQGIHPSPDPEHAYWITGGVAKSGTEHEMDEILRRAQARIFEGSREFFPYPFDPFHLLGEGNASDELRARFLAKDSGSVLDVLREGGAPQEEIDLADAYWSGGYQGNTAEGSPLMAMHWASLADHQSRLLDQLTLAFKLDNGMRGLYEAIAADVRGEIHLSTPVQRIEHGDQGVTVTLADGQQTTADAVIVTAPTGALRNLEFDPALSPEQQQLVDTGNLSTGLKIWIKIAGHHSIIAGAPHQYPITLLRSEYQLEDNSTILVAFGPDHTAIELTDRAAVQAMLDNWVPGLEVLDCTGHDWVADTWSGQTWATLRAGQFFNGWSAFLVGDDARLRFAGADWALGWNGVCVDGALESGITNARALITLFRGE